MTTAYLSIGAQTDDPDDLSIGQVTWPQTVNYLQVSGGEQILRNRGVQTLYTSSDGVTSVRFGSYYYNGSFVAGSPGQGTPPTYPNYFDGPWAVVPANTINHGDPLFEDIEIWGDVSYYPDPTLREYVITQRVPGQQQIYSSQIVPNSITPIHFHPVSAESGTLVGGSMRAEVYPSNSGNIVELCLYTTNNNEWVQWKTNDWSGDSQNVSGGIQGGYAIAQSATFNESQAGGDTGARTFPPCIYTQNDPYWNQHARSAWPNNSPGGAMVTFCTLFPGASTTATVATTGGSLGPDTYSIRYCYYKSLTVQSMVNRATITSGGTQGSTTATFNTVANLTAGEQVALRGGTAETVVVQSISGTTVTFASPIGQAGHTTAGWGSYTQIIETPLSTVETVTISGTPGSSGTNTITFTIPQIPSGWTGYFVYLARSSYQSTPAVMVPGISNAFTNGNNQLVVTVTSVNLTPDGTFSPSYGFSAWPSGTLIDKDPAAVTSHLKKLGHLKDAPDPPVSGSTQYYKVVTYNDGITASAPSDHPPGTIGPAHPNLTTSSNTPANATTTPTPNYLLALNGNGSAFVYVPNGSGSGTSGSSITNRGVTLAIDSNGHVTVTGGAPPALAVNPAGGTAVASSGSFIGFGSSDVRGLVSLTMTGGSVAVNTKLCTLTFSLAYASQQYVNLTAITTIAAQLGLWADTSSLGTISIWTAIAATPTAGQQVNFFYSVLG